MITQQAPRTLRIGHKKKTNRIKLSAICLALSAGIIAGTSINAFTAQESQTVESIHYLDVIEPAIQDANQIAEVYSSLIIQAQQDPAFLESETFRTGTTDSIEAMDQLIGRLRDTKTLSEAERLHKRNAIQAYARFTSGMESIRNGMLIMNEDLVQQGEDMISETSLFIESIDTTIPY